MKVLIAVLGVLLVVSAAWVVITSYNVYHAYTEPTPSPSTSSIVKDTDQESPVRNLVQGFAYDIIRVATPSSVTLVPNFTQKDDVTSLMDAHGCTQAINGGFYSEDSKPLGYFRTEESRVSSKILSDLFNGFFWIDTEEHPVIASELMNEPARIGLQSGPLLLFNSEPLKLAIHNDAGARRMVVAVTTDGNLLFMTLYSKDSVFDGPNLADLPSIVSEVSQKENLHIGEALNLDGGSASSFVSTTVNLSELTPVGSLFCIRG